jgi:hypothetical protein
MFIATCLLRQGENEFFLGSQDANTFISSLQTIQHSPCGEPQVLSVLSRSQKVEARGDRLLHFGNPACFDWKGRLPTSFLDHLSFPFL